MPLDRKRLIDHIAPTRKRVTAVRVEVEQALVDGDQVAARTRLVAQMRNGQTITTEIYMFGEMTADGRLGRAVQVTRALPAG